MWLKKLNIQTLLLAGLAFLVMAGIAYGAVYNLASSPKNASNASATTLGSKDKPHEISLSKAQEEPIDLVVKAGDYVQFNSKDGNEHQIVIGPAKQEHGATAPNHEASELSSGIIKKDEGYLLPLPNTGKFEFHDNYNHNYTITILVYAPAQN
jgi:plastocyanin